MKNYFEPEMEVVKLNVEDVITVSGDPDLGDDENGMGWA